MKNYKGLRLDFNTGEGELVLPDEFKDIIKSNPMLAYDIALDWLGEMESLVAEIQVEYDKRYN